MLSLRNFENEVNGIILQRGKSYFKQEAVVSLEQTGDDLWLAEVEGTEIYEVEVTLKNNDEITDFSCDCPFDGHVCKHAVAVFYALREEVKSRKIARPAGQKSKSIFESLVQQVSLPEYQNFVRHYAAANRTFKTDFELYFAEKDGRVDVEEKYEEIVKKLIRKYSDRGYINYRATYGLSRELDKMLANARELANKDNYPEAFVIARVLMKNLAQIQYQCDNSSGNISASLADTITFISDLSTDEETPPELKSAIFEFLKTELEETDYFNFGDTGYDLYVVFGDLAIRLKRAEEYLAFTDKQLAQVSGSFSDFDKEFYLQCKTDALQALGKTKEVENLVWENLDVVAIRQEEVEKALARKDYPAAKKLIQEGIKVAEAKGHPGTVTDWEKQLLRIAEAENDINKVRELTKNFAFDRGFDQNYYRQWKATYTPEDWKTVIDAYLKRRSSEIKKEWENQKNSYWRPKQPDYLAKLGPVYTEEGYHDRLLELVVQSKELNTVLQYHRVLAPHFPKELIAMYLPLLEEAGKQAADRKAYFNLAEVLKRIVKDIPAGKVAIKTLIEKMKAQNPRRPAMVEELNKVLKEMN